MIRDVLIPELEKKFGAGSFQTGESPIIVFPAKHPEVGDVRIWDDGDEATLSVGDITHGHFNPYDENLTQDQVDHEVTESVIDFLDALFSDRVLLWKSKSGHAGGWARLDVGKDEVKDDLISNFQKDAIYFVWSGPQMSP